jgi:hypothetical protein
MSKRKDIPNHDELQGEVDLEHAVGRPGKPHGVVVSVRLDEDEAQQLRSLAETERRTLSQLVRQAVSSYLASPSVDRRIADLPRTSGGGSAFGEIRIQFTNRHLPVGETDVVESVESGRVSSTASPVRLHTAT